MIMRALIPAFVMFVLCTPDTIQCGDRRHKFIIRTEVPENLCMPLATPATEKGTAEIKLVYYAKNKPELQEALNNDLGFPEEKEPFQILLHDVPITDLASVLERYEPFDLESDDPPMVVTHYHINIDNLSDEQKEHLADRATKLAALQLLAYCYLDGNQVKGNDIFRSLLPADASYTPTTYLPSLIPEIAKWLVAQQVPTDGILMHSNLLHATAHKELSSFQETQKKQTFFDEYPTLNPQSPGLKETFNALAHTIEIAWKEICQKQLNGSRETREACITQLLHDPRLVYLLKWHPIFRIDMQDLLVKSPERLEIVEMLEHCITDSHTHHDTSIDYITKPWLNHLRDDTYYTLCWKRDLPGALLVTGSMAAIIIGWIGWRVYKVSKKSDGKNGPLQPTARGANI